MNGGPFEIEIELETKHRCDGMDRVAYHTSHEIQTWIEHQAVTLSGRCVGIFADDVSGLGKRKDKLLKRGGDLRAQQQHTYTGQLTNYFVCTSTFARVYLLGLTAVTDAPTVESALHLTRKCLVLLWTHY